MPLLDLLLVTILPPRTDCTWPNSASDQQQSCISTSKFSKSQGMSQGLSSVVILSQYVFICQYLHLVFLWSSFDPSSPDGTPRPLSAFSSHTIWTMGAPQTRSIWHVGKAVLRKVKSSHGSHGNMANMNQLNQLPLKGTIVSEQNVRIWQNWCCYGDWAQLFFPSNYSLLSSASFSWHRTVSTHQHTSTWSDWKVEESQSFRLRSSTLLNSACSPPQSSITWKRSLHHCVFWVSFKVFLWILCVSLSYLSCLMPQRLGKAQTLFQCYRPCAGHWNPAKVLRTEIPEDGLFQITQFNIQMR